MKPLLVLLSFCCLASALWAQDRGVIECMGQSQVPAWSAPGSAHAIEQLACGQMVSIVGLERGYVRIQIGNRIGYVDARYVRLLQQLSDEQRRIAELEAQVRKLQEHPAAAQQEAPPPPVPSVSVPTAAPPTVSAPPNAPQAHEPAHAYPRAEVFGGYTYVHLDGGAGWMDGWNAAIAGNLHPIFGVKAEFSGLYAKDTLYQDIRYSGYAFMAGPQVSGRGRSVTAFAHALFGVEHLGASAPFLGLRVGASLNAFSMAIGGGLDWHGRRRIAWRIVQADYFPWRAFGGMAHNIRISSGIVVRFK